MSHRSQSYTAYSIGCAIVWAAVLAVVAAFGGKERLDRILPVFGGWWIGWTSATIARYSYPPPKSRPSWAHDEPWVHDERTGSTPR